MEEPTQVEPAPTQTPYPPSSAEAQTPQPQITKKRPLEGDDARISNTCYFKIRAVLGEIRPNVVEVLRTPDFRKSKAAKEIHEKVKLLMELYKQMTSETLSAPRCNDVPEGQLSSDAFTQDTRPSEHKVPLGMSDEKQPTGDGQTIGNYIVGGSVFGWNFITFSGMEPVYYGMTKESFRSHEAKLTSL